MKIKDCDKKCDKTAKIGDLFLRVMVGLIFIVAGYGKLFATPGIAGFTGMLQGIGVPAAGFFAVLVGIIELVGGIMLLLGLWTAVPATLLAIIMIVSTLTVRLPNGFNDARLDLLLLAASIRYIGTAGHYSLRQILKKSKK